MNSFIEKFHFSTIEYWDSKALSQFRGKCLNYSDLAREVAVLQDMWSKAGLKPGDKISINGRSSVGWITVFMASVTGGYVSVQLFNGFTPNDTQNLVDHSDSRLLYTEKEIFSAMDFEKMPQLIAAIDVHTGVLLASRGDFASIYESRYSDFDASWKYGFSKEDFLCRCNQRSYPGLDDVCAIMYTSGSTGNPKGVMLTVRNFSANVELVLEKLPMRRGGSHLSVLPFAHIFGLTVDGITSLCHGMHLCILGMLPLPKTLKEALNELRPGIFFAVPMIIAKLVDSILAEHNGSDEELKNSVLEAMGGRIEAIVTGGAAIPPDVEFLLAEKLKLPFITGYGMTECAPVISVGPLGCYKMKSCGQTDPKYGEVRIDSINPRSIPGEVLVKGDIVFKGYYKNPEATAQVLSSDGWLRTGDVGVLDEDRVLFLSGRCKNMILSTNGQNIFPEEVEVVLNSLPYVAESLVVMRNNAVHAIIVPDAKKLENSGFDAETLQSVMKETVSHLNGLIPKYSAVSSFELRFEPFAKTPKGSIKRFMYA